MVILQAQKINVSFGEQEVLRDISLSIQAGERVGLVGANGVGKTTLLKCLDGQMTPDSGELSYAATAARGYLEQLADFKEESTVWEVVLEGYKGVLEKRRLLHELESAMSQGGPELTRIMDDYARVSEAYERADGYACENKARRILIGLGFSPNDFDSRAGTLSGGQKTRLNLGRLLAKSPELLFLDEPTNHLDMNSVEWLEDFFITYPGTILVVSHDRRFLDKVATRILDLRPGELHSYAGNYSQFLEKRAAEDLAWQRAYRKQQEYIRQTEAYIRRFKAGIKSKQARGRQSQLERLERIAAPVQEKVLGHHSLAIKQESGQDVLTVKNISKSFGEKQILKRLHLQIKKGEKVALIGPNGCGKTTFLKIISQRLGADEGEVKIGSRVSIGYFGQEYDDLEPSNTVLEELLNHFEIKVEEARTALGTMLFSGDDVFKLVGDLSGGEKGRLAFLKLLLAGDNFLVLDEPTNHLDIESRQVVEQMLKDYEGTLLMVSHDRYFVDQVAERILTIENGNMECYDGNYSYYLEKKQAQKQLVQSDKKADRQQVLRSEWQAREEEKEQRRKKRWQQKQLEELEMRITELEGQKTDLETSLADPATYSDDENARAVTTAYRQLEQDLESAYCDWEKLNVELEASETKTAGLNPR